MVGRLRSSLSAEWAVFRALPRSARFLLGASTLFAFAAPVTGVFISAYIMRHSQDVVKVMAFQLASYTGVPLTFYLNGLLLRRFRADVLYAFGVMLNGISLLVMTLLPSLSMAGIALAGLAMGASTGFHWANRSQLSLLYTHDACRNYYFGVESFFFCLGSVTMPAAAGAFLAWAMRGDGGGLEPQTSYRLVAAGILLLSAGASAVLLRGEFCRFRAPLLVRLRADRVWCGLLALAALKGAVQVFQATMPAMLIMRVLERGEGALGVVQSVGAVAAAFLLYVVGRTTGPQHRAAVLAAALSINLFGTACNALWFNPAAALVFLACLLVALPMLEQAYAPIQLQVMDRMTLGAKDSAYAYFCGHELGLYVGRLVGAGAFILVARLMSDAVALRYVLFGVAAVQLLSLPIARGMVRRMAAERGPVGP